MIAPRLHFFVAALVCALAILTCVPAVVPLSGVSAATVIIGTKWSSWLQPCIGEPEYTTETTAGECQVTGNSRQDVPTFVFSFSKQSVAATKTEFSVVVIPSGPPLVHEGEVGTTDPNEEVDSGSTEDSEEPTEDDQARLPTSYRVFYHSESNSVHFYQYINTTCESSQLYNIVSRPVGVCEINGAQWSVTTPEDGPAPPLGAFPIAGFTTDVAYVNITRGEFFMSSVSTCKTSGQGVQQRSLAHGPTGVCLVNANSNLGQPGNSSKWVTCTQNGAYRTTLVFDGTACAPSAFKMAYSVEQGCFESTSAENSTCPAAASAFPPGLTALPIAGWTQCGDGFRPFTSYSAPLNTCWNSPFQGARRVVCTPGANGRKTMRIFQHRESDCSDEPINQLIHTNANGEHCDPFLNFIARCPPDSVNITSTSSSTGSIDCGPECSANVIAQTGWAVLLAVLTASVLAHTL